MTKHWWAYEIPMKLILSCLQLPWKRSNTADKHHSISASHRVPFSKFPPKSCNYIVILLYIVIMILLYKVIFTNKHPCTWLYYGNSGPWLKRKAPNKRQGASFPSLKFKQPITCQGGYFPPKFVPLPWRHRLHVAICSQCAMVERCFLHSPPCFYNVGPYVGREKQVSVT